MKKDLRDGDKEEIAIDIINAVLIPLKRIVRQGLDINQVIYNLEKEKKKIHKFFSKKNNHLFSFI